MRAKNAKFGHCALVTPTCCLVIQKSNVKH